jgi:hypothetical protein
MFEFYSGPYHGGVGTLRHLCTDCCPTNWDAQVYIYNKKTTKPPTW